MSAQTITLDLDYSFKWDNLSKDVETDPYLMFYTSTIFTWKNNVIEEKVRWENNDQTSAKGKVKVKVAHSNGRILYDDTLSIRLVVQTPNHEGWRCDAQAGNAMFFIREMIDQAREKNGHSFHQQIVLRSLGQNIPKGNITITLNNPNELSRLSYAERTPFSLCDHNQQFLMDLIDVTRERELAHFLQNEYGVNFEGLYESSTKLHDPTWSAELDVSSVYFWTCFKKRTFQAEFFENSLEIVLSRRNVSREKFVSIAHRQFEITQNILNDEFILVVRILGDMVALLANSLRYKTDETYKTKKSKKNMKHKPNHYVLELFFDAYTYRAADCEDDASLEHDIFRKILVGIEEYKDESTFHKRHGGWTSGAMDVLQRVANQYIGAGTLGNVTSRWLGENDTKAKRPHPVLIDSDEDKNVEEGGHMYYMAIPIPSFEKFINNLIPKKGEKTVIFEESDKEPWSRSLPILVCEGTGWMDPLIKPEVEYFTSFENKQQALKELEAKVNVMLEIAKRTCRIKKSEMQIFQMIAKPVNNTRLSKFYRVALACTTDQFLRDGYGAYKFFWVTDIGKRKQHVSQQVISFFGFGEDEEEDDSSSGIRIGANMRDIIYEADYVGLLVIPSMHPNEILAAKAKLRHFMPNRPILLQEKERLYQEYTSKLIPFKKDMDVIFREKKKSTEDEVKKLFMENRYFDVILRGEEALHSETQKQILADILRFPHMKGCSIHVEVVTDLVVNVRLRFYCQMVDKSYPTFDYEKVQSEMTSNEEIEVKVESKECYDVNDIIVASEIELNNKTVLVKWKGENGKAILYKFSTMDDKIAFMEELLETDHAMIEGRVVQNVKEKLKKGAEFARKEISKWKSGHKLLMSTRDARNYQLHDSFGKRGKKLGSSSSKKRH